MFVFASVCLKHSPIFFCSLVLLPVFIIYSCVNSRYFLYVMWLYFDLLWIITCTCLGDPHSFKKRLIYNYRFNGYWFLTFFVSLQYQFLISIMTFNSFRFFQFCKLVLTFVIYVFSWTNTLYYTTNSYENAVFQKNSIKGMNGRLWIFKSVDLWIISTWKFSRRSNVQ